MAYEDKFRLSVHAVILNTDGELLLLKANYANHSWGLPGGALDENETIHQALHRECYEELGSAIIVNYLSGVYYHKAHTSQAFIFRCELSEGLDIKLSSEHSQWAYHRIENLSEVQRIRVDDCINFDGSIKSRAF
ncbi:MAG: NUDIX hydrolase [Osedax symbiont Rs2]|nr:MAG: NUDIX hydrolase [Osedax symbiont Rs2]